MWNKIYFSLRRRPTEIFLFQRVKTCVKLFQNHFRSSLQLVDIFQCVQGCQNNFSGWNDFISVSDVIKSEIQDRNNFEVILMFYFSFDCYCFSNFCASKIAAQSVRVQQYRHQFSICFHIKSNNSNSVLFSAHPAIFQRCAVCLCRACLQPRTSDNLPQSEETFV